MAALCSEDFIRTQGPDGPYAHIKERAKSVHFYQAVIGLEERQWYGGPEFARAFKLVTMSATSTKYYICEPFW